MEYARERRIKVVSLAKEWDAINTISPTAEHALGLTPAAIRDIAHSFESVKRGEWDWTNYLGQQMDRTTLGVVG